MASLSVEPNTATTSPIRATTSETVTTGVSAEDRLHHDLVWYWVDSIMKREGGPIAAQWQRARTQEGDPVQQLTDGILLIRLIETLSGHRAPMPYHVNPEGLDEADSLENLHIALRMLRAEGLDPQLESAELYRSGPDRTSTWMDLLWRIALHFRIYRSIPSVGGATAKDAQVLDTIRDHLIGWAKEHTAGREEFGLDISDLHRCWLTGLGLFLLLHNYDSSIVSREELHQYKTQDDRKNLATAASLAKRHLGVPKLLFSGGREELPNEEAMLAYLIEFKYALDERERKAKERITEEEAGVARSIEEEDRRLQEEQRLAEERAMLNRQRLEEERRLLEREHELETERLEDEEKRLALQSKKAKKAQRRAEKMRKLLEERERQQEARREVSLKIAEMEDEKLRTETEKLGAERERTHIEEARIKAEEQRMQEERRRIQAEAHKERALEQRARVSAERVRMEDEKRRIEQERLEADELRHRAQVELRRAEEERLAALGARRKAEQDKLAAEADLQRAIETRRKAEMDRLLAEQEARNATLRREAAMKDRERFEAQRKKAEIERSAAAQSVKKKRSEKLRAEEDKQRLDEDMRRAEEERMRIISYADQMEGERLRYDDEVRRAEGERLHAEEMRRLAQQRIEEAERERLRAEDERRLARQELLLAEQARRHAEEERRRAEAEKIIAEQERLKADRERMRIDEEKARLERERAAERRGVAPPPVSLIPSPTEEEMEAERPLPPIPTVPVEVVREVTLIPIEVTAPAPAAIVEAAKAEEPTPSEVTPAPPTEKPQRDEEEERRRKKAEKRARKAEFDRYKAQRLRRKEEKKRHKAEEEKKKLEEYLQMTQKVLIGLATVRVVEARGLPKGADAVYAVVKLEDQLHKTNIIRKTANPRWYTEYTMYHSDPHASLKIKLYTKGRIGLRHHFVGMVSLPLKRLDEAAESETWYPLRARQKHEDKIKRKEKHKRQKERYKGWVPEEVKSWSKAEDLGELCLQVVYRKDPLMHHSSSAKTEHTH